MYVQPSRYEGRAVTVQEAQILQRPVVITNYKTAVSQLENGMDGIIVQNDIKACAQGIVDLLQDERYLALNARITAHCAVKVALQQLPVILDSCETLVIGWGRIGKCLAQLLQRMGANVTVCARKAADRSMLAALGYQVQDTQTVDLSAYRIIFNTVPTMLFPSCPGNGLKIDLASQLGLGSNDVIWARGLPGKDAPESSGTLIAETLLPLCSKESL
jgi:dipicolinate synthase subunit A